MKKKYVRCTPYLNKQTSYDHVKGQKMAQNDKKILSNLVSQEL